MSKPKMVKCRYSHCKHESKDVLKDEAVSDGKSYYHKDCYIEKETLKECIDVYVKNFESDPIFTQLRSVINDIVYNKGNEADFLLFALKYSASHKIPLRHIPGLYYIIKDNNIIKAWEKEKSLAARDKVVVSNTNTEYNYVQRKTKGFADILGG